MSNHLKKHSFSLSVGRLFTRQERDAYELIHFRESESEGDEVASRLECPENWSQEAAAMLAEKAGCKSVPRHLKPAEENTVPSWLWRRTGDKCDGIVETSAGQIFDRVVGAAVYTGWKQGVFDDEESARAFFDEARYALAQ